MSRKARNGVTALKSDRARASGSRDGSVENRVRRRFGRRRGRKAVAVVAAVAVAVVVVVRVIALIAVSAADFLVVLVAHVTAIGERAQGAEMQHMRSLEDRVSVIRCLRAGCAANMKKPPRGSPWWPEVDNRV